VAASLDSSKVENDFRRRDSRLNPRFRAIKSNNERKRTKFHDLT